MWGAIKTAIITIILSFISGVLLDYYKNIAPRIVCNMGKCTVIRIKGKKAKVYSLKVKNISKQIIHDLNLNLQVPSGKLRIDDAKVTKGLKFDISKTENTYDISIPFLSRNDEFSVKVLLEDFYNPKIKPIISLRSPEKFKRIDSSVKGGLLGSLNTISEVLKKKQIFIIVTAAILVILTGCLSAMYYKDKKAKSTDENKTISSESEENTGTSEPSTPTTSSNKESKKTANNQNSTVKNSSGSTSETSKSSGNSSNKTSANNKDISSKSKENSNVNSKEGGDNSQNKVNKDNNKTVTGNEKGDSQNKSGTSENNNSKKEESASSSESAGASKP